MSIQWVYRSEQGNHTLESWRLINAEGAAVASVVHDTDMYWDSDNYWRAYGSLLREDFVGTFSQDNLEAAKTAAMTAAVLKRMNGDPNG
jgi:hypothetical protein